MKDLKKVLQLLRRKNKFFNLGFKNKWQDTLPKEIVLKINSAFEKELNELGYLNNE